MPVGSGIAELGAYIGRRADFKRTLTMERIDTVNEDGTVMVKGQRLPVAGRVQLRAGMTVPVASRDGKMEVVLFGTARRTGGTGPTAVEIPVAVAEEFLVEPDELVQQFFRDQTNFVPVDLVAAQTESGIVGTVTLQWGVGDTSFVLMQGEGPSPTFHRIVAVCRINRAKKDTHFGSVKKVKLTLIRAYNLDTIGHTFGSITATYDVDTFVMPIEYFNVLTEPSGGDAVQLNSFCPRFYVAPNGDLLAVLGASAQVQGTGRDGVVMTLGSKLVNVTKNQVLANHMVDGFSRFVFTTPSATCGSPIQTLGVSVSTGVGLSASGTIHAVLSLKESNPSKVGTVNNYVLATPATTLNGPVFTGGPFSEAIYCGTPQANQTLMIEGEFPQQIDSLRGGSAVGITDLDVIQTLQGARRGLVWSVVRRNAELPRRIRIADLPKETVSIVAGRFTEDTMGGEPGGRKFFMGKDELGYAPDDRTPPFTKQFYWAGHQQGGGWSVNLDVAKKRSELQPVAKRAAPKTAAQRDAILAGGGDLQVFQEPR